MADDQGVVELRDKVVGDDWVIPVYVDESSTLDMSDWDPEQTRAQLRAGDGTLLAEGVVTGDAPAGAPVVFDGDEDRSVPATNLEAGELIMLVRDVDNVDMPTGNPVYLQVSTVAASLMGRQTIATYSWIPRAQVEVNP